MWSLNGSFYIKFSAIFLFILLIIPYRTDCQQSILDTTFTNKADYTDLDNKLNNIPGVPGHGIFINLADKIVVGGRKGVQVME